MKKTIKLTESQLLDIVKKVLILEQTLDDNRKKVIKSLVDKVVDAVKGTGTDPDEIYSAVSQLKTNEEGYYFIELFFYDKRTGYNSFVNMINGEYERDNVEDVKKLILHFRKLGIGFTSQYYKNSIGKTFFRPNSFMLADHSKKSDIPNCKSKWEAQLPNAIKFWRDWLSNPITMEKVRNNYIKDDKSKMGLNIPYPGISPLNNYSFKPVFKKYFELLNNIKMYFYDDTMEEVNGTITEKNAQAFAKLKLLGMSNEIYINCSGSDQLTDDEIVDTLVHEIQHLIYHILPLNPDKQLSSAFVGKNTPIKTRREIESDLYAKPTNKPKPEKSYSPEIVDTSNRLDIPYDILERWVSSKKLNSFNILDPGYFCRNTENASKIMAMRHLFNLKPGQNITFEMLKPYLMFEKEDMEVTYFLFCWVENGFPDINQFLNKINQLAMNKQKNNFSVNKG